MRGENITVTVYVAVEGTIDSCFDSRPIALNRGIFELKLILLVDTVSGCENPVMIKQCAATVEFPAQI